VGFAIFRGENCDLARQAVTEIVAAGHGFAFDGLGAGGTLSVAAIGFELFIGDRHYDESFCGAAAPK